VVLKAVPNYASDQNESLWLAPKTGLSLRLSGLLPVEVPVLSLLSVFGADVENGFIEVHIFDLQLCDLSQAGPSVGQQEQKVLRNVTAGKSRYHEVELLICDWKSIGVAASRSLDLDGLEHIPEVQIPVFSSLAMC
jgi:hypothetical protein